MSRRRRFTLAALGASVLLLGSVVWQQRYCVLLRNVRVVEPDQIYRGGLHQPGPLRRLIRTYGIRTILSLRGPCDSEEQIAGEMGVEWIRCDLDAAEAEGRIVTALETAAGVLADPSKRPVYFHCVRGWDRSNVVQAAYRMLACGWTLDRAVAELEQMGFDPIDDTVDARRHKQLLAFYQASVRLKSQSRNSPGQATDPICGIEKE